MKVLVTGASGFLGQYALAALQQAGIAAVALARTRPRDLAGAQFVPGDLLEYADLAKLVQRVGASHLLHLAWVTDHGAYWSSPLNFRWVDATTRLVEAFCQAGGKHAVLAGTCAEYDWGHGRCEEDSTPLNPATVYGVAKDATRRLVAALCAQHQVRCAWARIFFPYGAGENPARLVPALVNALRGQRAPFGISAAVYRDFLHARDVAQGLLTLLQTDARGSYNISSDQPVQLASLVHTLAQLMQTDARPLLDLPPQRLAEPALVAGENLKLKALGWQQQFTLLQGLAQMLSDLPVVRSGQRSGVAVDGP